MNGMNQKRVYLNALKRKATLIITLSDFVTLVCPKAHFADSVKTFLGFAKHS
jgi:hypothetical protein